ncbi:hypothetical protein Acy02nite_18250 [Actinoplanes cyaneus]|uniref:Secreted protein n=1 Tax=Actinoplanes cyaneus TaxID=52696 RepID=A0A919IE62_9ACTN|nr:hypothetical protein [Actinoplanes cyaneus]MCW2136905.1 hypothetical protein [Actinoplanes cyaneus]GID63944.1 hypothetical protein Acy02nite_18250 [Actinoplanes cyaneus]
MDVPTEDPPRRKSKWSLDLTDEEPGAPTGATVGEPEKNSTFRFAAIGALLIVVLFAGYGLGRLNNGTGASTTTTTPAAATSTGSTVVNENMPHTHGAAGTGAAATGAVVGGLSLSSDGLTLHPRTTMFEAGKKQPLNFTIDATGGTPVTSYAIVHDKPLHLIVARRDLTGFQHLHPVMADDGTWSIDLTLAQPGVYRMIADFTALVGGRQIATTLGTDLTVAGDYAPQALPAASDRATVAGLTVTYEGKPDTKAVQPLLMTVTGGAVEPYLGAFGHLVVLRQGDVAYLHVHPEQQLVDGKVKFWVTAPSPGAYRMFFDFQVAGQVHTAEWTLEVG